MQQWEDSASQAPIDKFFWVCSTWCSCTLIELLRSWLWRWIDIWKLGQACCTATGHQRRHCETRAHGQAHTLLWESWIHQREDGASKWQCRLRLWEGAWTRRCGMCGSGGAGGDLRAVERSANQCSSLRRHCRREPAARGRHGRIKIICLVCTGRNSWRPCAARSKWALARSTARRWGCHLSVDALRVPEDSGAKIFLEAVWQPRDDTELEHGEQDSRSSSMTWIKMAQNSYTKIAKRVGAKGLLNVIQSHL